MRVVINRRDKQSPLPILSYRNWGTWTVGWANIPRFQPWFIWRGNFLLLPRLKIHVWQIGRYWLTHCKPKPEGPMIYGRRA